MCGKKFIQISAEISKAKNINILKRMLNKDGVDWIQLAQDRAQKRTLANTVINTGISQKAGNLLTK
jgi:hypothetical protein